MSDTLLRVILLGDKGKGKGEESSGTAAASGVHFTPAALEFFSASVSEVMHTVLRLCRRCRNIEDQFQVPVLTIGV